MKKRTPEPTPTPTPIDDEEAKTDATIGRNLEKFRLEFGLDHAGAELLTKIPASSLKKYESGISSIRAARLKRIADKLRRPITDFFLDDPPASKPENIPSFLVAPRRGIELDDHDRAALRRMEQVAEEENANRWARLNPRKKK